MNPHRRLLPLLLALTALSICARDLRAEGEGNAQQAVADEFFEKHVRPVLVERCIKCHGAQKQEAGFRFDSRSAMIEGSGGTPAIVPGSPEKSRILAVINYSVDDVQMPPTGQLEVAEIEALTAWVKAGAPWPAASAPLISSEAAPNWKEHWAFQPVTSAPLPSVQNAEWEKTAVDAFVLAKLEEHKLSPAPPADRHTLLRRLNLDLIGLPPTSVEVAEFAADTSPDAVEKVVDRLLDSPHYGERWGRYWLDIVRYADTKGYVFTADRNYYEAPKYRDWVVKSLNDDMPYDRFIMLQLAADQVAPGDTESLAAMGMLTLGRRFLNNIHDIIDDRIDVVTRGLMGMTVTCARCHDHKYDPIPTADYYSLYGVFRSSDEPGNEPCSLRLVDAEKPFDPYVFVRGQAGNQGQQVPRQFLMAISGETREPFQKGSGRLELAQEIASRDNPLTARVFVNRVWGQLFGRPLVDTPSDFGMRSEAPSHPELLDHLASRFMDKGWSRKKLHRWIVLSSTYQQSSECGIRSAESGNSVDPENRLLWRMNRRRLDFEAQRDSILSACGTLDLTLGGPSVQLTTEPFTTRRTIYGFIDRQNLPPLFRTFDFASPDTHSPQRYHTTVPQQALYLLNSPFLMQQAHQLVARPEVAAIDDPQLRVKRLYELTLGRAPTPEELSLALEFTYAAAESEAIVAETPWKYGYGRFDEASKRVASFAELPHFNGSEYSGGKERPDPKLGWVILKADGGHAGNDAAHAAIRRWIAPADGKLTIEGRLKHAREEGDGVRCMIVSSGRGVLGDWSVHNTGRRTSVDSVDVKAGETIDFVTSCRENPTHDSFEWGVRLTLRGTEESAEQIWGSRSQFRGPQLPPLDAWEQFAQVLLLSNEFAFVD